MTTNFYLPKTIEEAKTLQDKLKKEVILDNEIKLPIKKFLAMDVSSSSKINRVVSSVILFSYPELKIIEESLHIDKVSFPYIPGLLAFREIPPLLKAIEKIKGSFDLLFIEGQGIAHPRHFGVASHLGVLLRMPSIGCAKNLLWGSHNTVENEVGSFSYIFDRGNIIGLCLRTKKNVRPIYISQGNKISLDIAKEFVMSTLRGYRLPEPLRICHQKAKDSLLSNLTNEF